MTVGVIQRLAALAARPIPSDLLDLVNGQTSWAVADLIGCALAGGNEAVSRIVTADALADASAARAVLVSGAGGTAPSLAALVNAVAGHALDFDDVGRQPGSGHPSVTVVPAALALAETNDVTGADLLAAVAAGYEVVARMGAAAHGVTGRAYLRGGHGTAMFGVFGAAAASARLLGLTDVQIGHALAIAASFSGGLRASFGSMAKAVQVGEASRCGVRAAELAARGFSANPYVMEDKDGWIQVVADGEFDPAILSDDQGKPEFDIANGIVAKLYPSCAASHGPVHVLRQILAQVAGGSAVHAIRAEVPASLLRDSLRFDWPTNPNEARFSLAFCLAAVWDGGTVRLTDFTGESLSRLAALRGNIDVVAIDAPRATPAIVRVMFEDGTMRTAPSPPAAQIPASAQALTEKFLANAGASGRAIDGPALLAAIAGLACAPNVHDVTGLLWGDCERTARDNSGRKSVDPVYSRT